MQVEYKHDEASLAKLSKTWESKISQIFSSTEDEMTQLLSVVMILMGGKSNKGFPALYAVLKDLNLLSAIVNTLSGMTITIPDKDSFKEALQIAIAYYYHEIKKLEWKDVSSLFQDEKEFVSKAEIGIRRINKETRQELNSILGDIPKIDIGKFDTGVLNSIGMVPHE